MVAVSNGSRLETGSLLQIFLADFRPAIGVPLKLQNCHCDAAVRPLSGPGA